MPRRRTRRSHERYELERSPLAQKPTQRDIGLLVRETRDDLQKLATPRFKEQFLVRRTVTSGGKKRALVYPDGRLRAVHERLKFHLNKIVQPSYLMSPRKGRSQRDNAAAHIDAVQYLTLDIQQFYPSTTRSMIRRSLIDQFGMSGDVAGLIAHIATADDRACFGSPLTPVLMTLVHRPMFDAIADLCAEHGLAYSVWVDDLTVSGDEISGAFVVALRNCIARHGLRSHKLDYRTGNRAVFITGVGVVGRELIVPYRTELRSKDLWQNFQEARLQGDTDAIDVTGARLLAHLGGIRHIVGLSSSRGKKLANEINSIRQKRAKALKAVSAQFTGRQTELRRLTVAEQEARAEEIAAVPF